MVTKILDFSKIFVKTVALIIFIIACIFGVMLGLAITFTANAVGGIIVTIISIALPMSIWIYKLEH
jgi:hypothetical protein